MYTMAKVVLLCTMIGALYAANVERSSKLPMEAWVECTTHSDCAQGFVCTIAHEKYSYPACKEELREGDFCRPNAPRAVNETFNYPDGSHIFIKDAYYMLAPCSAGLVCDRKDGICRDANLVKNN